MSESDGGPGRREVAYRLFAAEYDDADLSHSESDEERAPNYVITPTGARVNRLFVVGVLTEVESVSDDYLRARVVDPTGPFVVYAGQYQPEAMRFLESAEPPTFVAVTGKARTFQPDDSDRVYTSIRPESINEVDADTRDRWVIQAAVATLDRVARVAEATATGLAGDDLQATLAAGDVEEGLAHGIPVALDHYGTTGEYLTALREVSLDALRVVSGDRDEVGASLPAPDSGSDDSVADLTERTLDPVTAETDDEAAEEDVVSGEDSASEAVESASAEPDSEVAQTGDAGTETAAPETESADAQVATAGDAGSTTEPDPGEDSIPGDADDETTTDADEATTPTDADDSSEALGDFELDESEREEIESEYGTEFKSGTEVEEPGEADIETPDPDADEETAADRDDVEEETAPAGAEQVEESAESSPEPAVGDGDAETEEPADVALDDAAMNVMSDLDEGDGADREAVIAAVVDDTGADPGTVEDAIQDALMDGRCYEPTDGTLKPI